MWPTLLLLHSFEGGLLEGRRQSLCLLPSVTSFLHHLGGLLSDRAIMAVLLHACEQTSCFLLACGHIAPAAVVVYRLSVFGFVGAGICLISPSLFVVSRYVL